MSADKKLTLDSELGFSELGDKDKMSFSILGDGKLLKMEALNFESFGMRKETVTVLKRTEQTEPLFQAVEKMLKEDMASKI